MKQLLLIFLLAVSTAVYCQNNTNWKLWYDHPSGKTWENALPIGNGKQVRSVIFKRFHVIFSQSHLTIAQIR